MTKRNYKQEYREFHSRPEQKRRRALRNRARRRALRQGLVRKGDGKDLHHPNGLHSDRVVVMDRSRNRGMAEKSRLPGSTRRRRRRGYRP